MVATDLESSTSTTLCLAVLVGSITSVMHTTQHDCQVVDFSPVIDSTTVTAQNCAQAAQWLAM